MKRLFAPILAVALAASFVVSIHPAAAEVPVRPGFEETIAAAAPDPGLAARLFGVSGPVTVERTEGDAPGWAVTGAGGAVLGHIGSSWELSRSVGYSGRPIDILVAVDPSAHIVGARLMRQNEPILSLGISDEDIARFVEGFAGGDLTRPLETAALAEAGAPDIISRATVSTGVIRDSILRTGRILALSRGLLSGGRIERLAFAPHSWAELAGMGAIRSRAVTMTEAAQALAGADTPPEPGAGYFIDLHVAVLDPPEIGRNILGQQAYTRAVGALPAGKVALFVASRGLYSHRGLNWRRSGVFDLIAVVQDGRRYSLTKEGYTRIDRLALKDAPDFKERSVFQLGGEGFDPAAPFRVEVTATRKAGDGEVSMVIGVDYRLPEKFLKPLPPEPLPLWERVWAQKWPAVAVALTMQGALTLLFLFQGAVVRRRKLWMGFRIGFLTLTLFVLGWGLGGQLSVVQVVAFVQSLLTGFHWETFLMEPVIFVLWSGVALGLLFWGRGVYCGWLCPFGALQELTNLIARRFGVKQVEVPHAIHERLWIIKYTLFILILGLSFYSMVDALLLAEAEPFKTAITMRMLRAWPFVLFVLALLVAGLFIERFYCRYICPLGAALAIPAKLKIFDWLDRRPQCGRECRLCEQKCTVGAIDPLGRINPNECVLCLRCQVIFNDEKTCPTLMRRARARKAQAEMAAKQAAKEATP
ncbi:NosR/NirI family protein [Jhaorihella thermophila]|uniref:NosR/NirI family transcriptional regulator, nitrite reductase regulator n=1 Tax=Jhaorihella thermophila TaxID=488547 RepID=A0A1H5X8B6_9RHOB|nr:NosR/NirI family protein [Jhaorihella thermophila]SEG07969.1 NosR/NirI family transcriptional regulator, nitrite reductase regulator [Jhaorihella thermophila]